MRKSPIGNQAIEPVSCTTKFPDSADMLNLIISTIVFFVAAWFINHYLDEQAILPKGTTRGVLVFLIAFLLSWGSGEIVDWTQAKIEGPQAAAQTADLSSLLKAVGQQQP